MSHGERDPSAQSPRSLRGEEVRRTNHTDVRGATVLHDDYDPAVSPGTDVPLIEATAEYGDAIRVLGFERITLLMQWVKGTADGFNVAAQVSPDERRWYDLYEDEGGDGTLVRKVWELATPADADVAWTIDTHGVLMRFKVWASGGANVGTRALLRGTRLMDAR